MNDICDLIIALLIVAVLLTGVIIGIATPIWLVMLAFEPISFTGACVATITFLIVDTIGCIVAKS